MPFDIPAQMTVREAVGKADEAVDRGATAEAQVHATLAVALAIENASHLEGAVSALEQIAADQATDEHDEPRWTTRLAREALARRSPSPSRTRAGGRGTMTFEQAWQRVALAGRELGSGPALAGARLVGDEPVAWLTGRQVPQLNAGCIRLGVAVGLVMAEDPAALAALQEINEEWLQQAGELRGSNAQDDLATEER